ncbi:MAG: serine/threonine-protein kinase [Myxococcales bacterium]|nr:serine/threonine-protein kinase [Myxococcales bacterium]
MSPSDDAVSPIPPAAARHAPGAGDVLCERYRLVQRIATGGSAEVFEAEHAVTRRRVAVKVLRTDVRGELASVERFFREASACAGIDSDHIVAVLDCDVDKATDSPFIVMELLHGKDLARFIADTLAQGTPVPPSLAMNLLKQVASALDKVHARGIVHRDLKPANLFLTFPSDGPARVKVLDFGIARIAADGAASGGARVGTPLYMSAEQLSGRAEVTPAADIWSFALIAYELLVGHPYWENNTATSLFARIPDAESHPRPTELAARHGVHLPRAFDPWLLRCIDPDPARRPPTVGEALGDLLRLYDPKATQPPTRAAAPPARLAPRASARPSAPSLQGPRMAIPLPSRAPPEPAAPSKPAAPPAPSKPAPAPPLSRPNPTEELDDAEIEDLTETSDRPPSLSIPPPAPASEARTRQMAPVAVARDDEDRRLTVPMAPVVADLFGPPLRSDPAPDERVTAEVPAVTHLPSTATPRERFLSPDPAPELEPVDTLGANVAAAMESPDASVRSRRIPRSVELASTALLPVHAPVPPAPAVRPTTLLAAAAVTLGLAGAAGWVLFGHRAPAAHGARGDGLWRSPSAFESASLAATTVTWASALRALAEGAARPAGADTARALHALLEAHRAGVPLPPERQISLLIALDRLRTPHGWPAAEAGAPDAGATAWAALAYASMAEVTQVDTARVRVEVARDALLALQQPDGSFDADSDPVASPLRATAVAVSALLAAESALRAPRPDDVAARRRAVRFLRAGLQRADHPVWSAPAALDLAVAALWSARAHAHDADPADAVIAGRYADHLGDRCPDHRCAPPPPLADAPWLPGALATAARLLRDPASLPSSSQRALSAFVRAGVAAVDRDRAYAGDLGWHATALVAVSDLQR